MSNAYLGEIRMIGFTFAPRGWAFCNGATLSVQQNAALFSLLGTSFGGNGTTNFMLPNLQSRLPIGVGTGAGLNNYVLGQVGGAQAANLAVNNLPAHNHMVTGSVTVGTYSKLGDIGEPQGHVLAKAQATTTPPALVEAYSDQLPDSTLGGVNSTLGTAPTGSGLPVPILPPFLAINYVVVLQGLFPSRN